jgi:hypothetical protein
MRGSWLPLRLPIRYQKGLKPPLLATKIRLGDRVPLRLMRENDLETVAPEIMGAARAFLVGG